GRSYGMSIAEGLRSAIPALRAAARAAQAALKNQTVIGANPGYLKDKDITAATASGFGGLAALGRAALGSYATGTDFVPVTGMYQLHRGEQVIPAGRQSGPVLV